MATRAALSSLRLALVAGAPACGDPAAPTDATAPDVDAAAPDATAPDVDAVPADADAAVPPDAVALGRCLVAGAPCDPSADHPLAFACVADAGGGARCQPTCRRAEDCADGTACDVELGPRPTCVPRDCAGPWDDRCGAGRRCSAARWDPEPAFTCAPITAQGAAGDACASDVACAAALFCRDGACAAKGCAPVSGDVACPGGTLCLSGERERAVDLGTCTPTDCDPLAAAPCGVGERCLPIGRDAVTGLHGGRCAPVGAGPQDSACAAHSDCASGLACVDGRCAAGAWCDAAPGAPPGACASPSFCAPALGGWSATTVGPSPLGRPRVDGDRLVLAAPGFWDGTYDSLAFVHRPAAGGDVAAAVRVVSVAPDAASYPGSGAALMLRADLAPDAPFLAVVVTSSGAVSLAWRGAPGAATLVERGPAVALPVVVRLVRRGDVVAAYVAQDALLWTQVGEPHALAVAAPVLGVSATTGAELAGFTRDGAALAWVDAADLGTCQVFSCEALASPGACASGEGCWPAATNPDTGALVGQCRDVAAAAPGDPCEGDADCGRDQLCDGPTCRSLCDAGAADGGHGACAGGERCRARGDGSPLARCVPSCDALDASACDAGLGCLGEGGGFERYGGCVATGSAGVGDACTSAFSGECAPGLGCYPTSDGLSLCRALCDPQAADPDAACADGQTCWPVAPDGRPPTLGFCRAMCGVFDADACAADETCAVESSASGLGTCRPAGPRAAGELCDHGANNCAHGLMCAGRCVVACHPFTGGAACPDAGDACRPLGLAGTVIGYCKSPCTPLSAEDGCGPAETCFPSWTDASDGACWPAGTAAEGDACAGECGVGLLCAEGVCRRLCDLTSAAPSCGEGDVCVGGGVGVPFGVCRAGCAAGDATSCPGGQTCVARELARASATGDYCRPGAPIAACTSGSGALCGDGLAGCLDIPELTDGVACVELCRASAGPMLQVGHPDCADPVAVCDPTSAPGLGLCHGLP